MTKVQADKRTPGNPHATFCPRRVSWGAACSCDVKHLGHSPECPAVAVDFNDVGPCDCGLDGPCDEAKYRIADETKDISFESLPANPDAVFAVPCRCCFCGKPVSPDEITSEETICVSTADAEWAIRKFVKPNTMRAIIDRLKKRSN